jgi:hypothetical protein
VDSDAVGQIPFVVIAASLGIVALGMVALGWFLKLGIYSLGLLVVPLVIGWFYISKYSERPYEPRVPPRSATAAPPSTEPFDDPVEEADRIGPVPAEAGPAPTADSAEPTAEPPPSESLDDPVEEADRIGQVPAKAERDPTPDTADLDGEARPPEP